MSVLSWPRICFKGQIWWNPGTANNIGAGCTDRSTGALIMPPGLNHAGLSNYLMEIENGKIRCGYNLYGDNACAFTQDTAVTSGVLTDGQTPADDRLFGARVRIAGSDGDKSPCRITDVDPYAGWSSKLYMDKLVIGDEETGIIAGGAAHTLFTALDYTRNYNALNDLVMAGPAAVIWQTTVPRSGIHTPNAASSGLLDDIAKGLQKNGVAGLMIRFCSYRTCYYRNGLEGEQFPEPCPRNDAELHELYMAGRVFSNPAWSLVVGAIGLWETNEPSTTPVGRMLSAASRIAPFNVMKTGVPVAAIGLGPATAELDTRTKRLSVDFMGTFPEWDSSGLKADFGPVALQVVDRQGSVSDIALVDYNRYAQESYEQKAGIVDVIVTKEIAKKIDKGLLRLTVNRPEIAPPGRPFAEVALTERPLCALALERGVYIQQDEPRESTIRVFSRGIAAPNTTRVLFAQYEYDYRRFIWNLLPQPKDGVSSTATDVNTVRAPAGASPRDVAALRRASEVQNADAAASIPSAGPYVAIVPRHPVRGLDLVGAKVSKHGYVKVTLEPLRPGCFSILLLPYAADGPVPIAPQLLDTTAMLGLLKYGDFLTGRVLPFDNHLDRMDAAELTWDFIFNNILSVYAVLQPVTSRSEHHPSLSDQRQMESARQMIKQLIDPDRFGHTLQMPVTRDLSGGKRRALMRWCDQTPSP